MNPSPQLIAEWKPELDWMRAEAERILHRLTHQGADPPGKQAERRRVLMRETR